MVKYVGVRRAALQIRSEEFLVKLEMEWIPLDNSFCQLCRALVRAAQPGVLQDPPVNMQAKRLYLQLSDGINWPFLQLKVKKLGEKMEKIMFKLCQVSY